MSISKEPIFKSLIDTIEAVILLGVLGLREHIGRSVTLDMIDDWEGAVRARIGKSMLEAVTAADAQRAVDEIVRRKR